MRIVAPLLVLSVLALVGWRWLEDPARDWHRRRIEAAWDVASFRPEAHDDLVRRTRDWLNAYGDQDEARWFAARSWLKLGLVEEAIDTIWGEGGLAGEEGTARRFGESVLRTVGFLDEDTLGRPQAHAVTASMVLADGGDEEAARWLDDVVRNRLEGAFHGTLYGAELYASQATRDLVAKALRSRGQEEPAVVAAVFSARPETYAEKAEDLVHLRTVVQSALRWHEHMVWAEACLALGRSEDVGGQALLEDVAARLRRLGEERDTRDAAICAAGLLAAGRWGVEAQLRPYLGPGGARTRVKPWIAEALEQQVRRGNARADDAALALWGSLHVEADPPLRARFAFALLQGPALPPEDLAVDRLLTDMESPTGGPAERAVAAAFRYRRGEETARTRLLEVLREQARRGWLEADPGLLDAIHLSPLIVAARALYLYGGAGAAP